MCLMQNTESLWGQVLLAEGPEKLLNIGWCHGKLRLDDCCWNKTLRILCLVKLEQDCPNKHSKQWHHGNQSGEKFSLIILISSKALCADFMSCSKQQKSYKRRRRNIPLLPHSRNKCAIGAFMVKTKNPTVFNFSCNGNILWRSLYVM